MSWNGKWCITIVCSAPSNRYGTSPVGSLSSYYQITIPSCLVVVIRCHISRDETSRYSATNQLFHDLAGSYHCTWQNRDFLCMYIYIIFIVNIYLHVYTYIYTYNALNIDPIQYIEMISTQQGFGQSTGARTPSFAPPAQRKPQPATARGCCCSCAPGIWSRSGNLRWSDGI
jgi:hypothetical protein